MSSAVLYAEVSITCILFLIMMSVKANKSVFLEAQRQGFVVVALSNALLFALDAVWIFVDQGTLGISRTMNWILNGTYYAVSGLLGYIWFRFSETMQGSRFVSEKKYRWLALLPALVLIVLTVLSVWNHWLFYIDANNAYHRGPAYSLQVILAYGYVIFTALKAHLLSVRADDYRRKKELRTLSSFVIPTLLSGVLQIVFPRYPILCVGSTLGILYIYLTLAEQAVSVDMLTQLSNRNQLYQILSNKFKHRPEDEALYLLMIDVNKFKAINDAWGHTEGDHALRLVADGLRRSAGTKGNVIARYGGDEFMVLCELENDHAVESLVTRIHETIGEAEVSYPLSVSIGYARLTSDVKTPQELIALADKELYKAKTRYQADMSA